ncbi:MAG: Arylsulfatase [Lentisphaerae bacterium ADurb.BinA184]|nr:MAG: Arylsulfatase [Lentisphaerae bacterium ADurb.BinA184]
MHNQPDILLIMPDQMRGDCLSLAGHPVVRTPVLDEVGGQGAHFTRAYSACPSCIPARRVLLTGQCPATGGMVGFRAAPVKSPTLPQLLRDGGYATRLAGRHMHQEPYGEPYGYEEQVLGSCYVPDDDYARFLDRHAPHVGGIRGVVTSFNGWHARPWPLPEDLHPTAWVSAQARRLLAAAPASQPLFLTASYYAPHPPLVPPAWYLDYYLRQPLPAAAHGAWVDWERLPAAGAPVDAHRVRLEGEALRLAQAGYFGLIHQLDDQLYWLAEEFRHHARAAGRPWLIVVTSDHGEMLGDHGYFRKCEPYEGSARIPLLIQGSPELGLRPGLVSRQPVGLEDVMPTLLDAAGLACPPRADGVSLLPHLRGEAPTVRPWLHAEHSPCYSQDQAFHMLTDGRWKYIWRPHDGGEQLFDLDADPREERDLAAAPRHGTQACHWRHVLMARLAGRPEGFTDGRRLLPGRPYPALFADPARKTAPAGRDRGAVSG